MWLLLIFGCVRGVCIHPDDPPWCAYGVPRSQCTDNWVWIANTTCEAEGYEVECLRVDEDERPNTVFTRTDAECSALDTGL